MKRAQKTTKKEWSHTNEIIGRRLPVASVPMVVRSAVAGASLEVTSRPGFFMLWVSGVLYMCINLPSLCFLGGIFRCHSQMKRARKTTKKEGSHTSEIIGRRLSVAFVAMLARSAVLEYLECRLK